MFITTRTLPEIPVFSTYSELRSTLSSRVANFCPVRNR